MGEECKEYQWSRHGHGLGHGVGFIISSGD